MRECTEYDVDVPPNEQSENVQWFENGQQWKNQQTLQEDVSRDEYWYKDRKRWLALQTPHKDDLSALALAASRGMDPLRVSKGEVLRMLRTLQDRPIPALRLSRLFTPSYNLVLYLDVELVAEWRVHREDQERRVLRWAVKDLTSYDPDKTLDEQVTDNDWYAHDDVWLMKDGLDVYTVTYDMNYVVISEMGIKQLAHYILIGGWFNMTFERIHDILRALEHRSLTTDRYIPPFCPDKSKPNNGRPAYTTGTIAALRRVYEDTESDDGDDGQVQFAVELLREPE